MTASEPTITAFLIDDSAVVRRHLAQLLTDACIEVIGTASDPVFAWPKLQARWPDVIVLDVEMPRMDGISFLRQIMAQHPTPVVMCSTLTAAGATTTLQALAEGAVSFVTKPKLGLRDYLADSANGLPDAVRAAARANVRRMSSAREVPVAPVLAAPRPQALAETTDRVVAIGSSTGGVQAIETVLTRLPRTMSGIVIVQHMPAAFTKALAQRLDGLCEMDVREARDGDRVINGRVLIAPGGMHMQLARSGAQYVVSVRDGPLVNRHKPSVDVLLRSVAQTAGSNACGIVLTGMGDDGARGLLEMRHAGALTAAQDEASSVVYGMPREAWEQGGAERQLPLDAVADHLVRLCHTTPPTHARA